MRCEPKRGNQWIVELAERDGGCAESAGGPAGHGQAMKPRVRLGRKLLRLSGFVQSLAVAVMRPRDIIESNRLTYELPDVGGVWARDELVDSGLNPGELALLKLVPLRRGRILVLFAGGGREAIAFARVGFEPTCIDFIPGLTEKAKANANRRGLHIEALTQDISELDLPAGSFDIAWLGSRMYSSIPGQATRVRMLQRVANTLTAEGLLVCQFDWDPAVRRRRASDLVRIAVAALSAGNLQYQNSDRFMEPSEFTHHFSTVAELQTEFSRGGFDVLDIRVRDKWSYGGAVLSKAGGRRRENQGSQAPSEPRAFE